VNPNPTAKRTVNPNPNRRYWSYLKKIQGHLTPEFIDIKFTKSSIAYEQLGEIKASLEILKS